MAWEKENWIVYGTAADKFGSLLYYFNYHNCLKNTLHFGYILVIF